MKNVNKIAFDTLTVANSTLNGNVVDVRECLGCVIDIAYTGTSLQGTIKLQGSLDGENYFDYPNSGASAVHTIVAAGSNAQWYLTDIFLAYLRVVITSTDADVLTISRSRVFAKGV